MNRVVSFTDDGDIRVESETAIEVLCSGVVLLTLEQAWIAVMVHGWKLDKEPFSKETEPWLYSVRR